MPDHEEQPDQERTRRVPSVVSPTRNSKNSLNVAFPFSSISVVGPSEELAELAGIVADLITALEAAVPGPSVRELRERAGRLKDRLAS